MLASRKLCNRLVNMVKLLFSIYAMGNRGLVRHVADGGGRRRACGALRVASV
jgi:hypothetical protein